MPAATVFLDKLNEAVLKFSASSAFRIHVSLEGIRENSSGAACCSSSQAPLDVATEHLQLHLPAEQQFCSRNHNPETPQSSL